MCGIVGAVGVGDEAPLTETALVRARDTLTHRGPDDAGHHLAAGVALGSRRLAILDLSAAGHMPMRDQRGRYWIAYNGEIYNYRELRASLVPHGYVFRSNSDTEVLLALYAHLGPAMLDKLNGMFAVAIWDSQERTLFMARDRLGIKPLYYAVLDGRMLFASEEKALFAAGVPSTFDPDTYEELLRFNYVAGERTPFTHVRRLLPGHYLRWQNGNITIRRWWSLAERVAERREAVADDLTTWFHNTFDNAVALRRISDVPVGVLLSGGLDSSSVASSLAAQTGEGVASFTVRFRDDPHYDEGPLARIVADRWHLEHHELDVAAEEMLERLGRASWMNDEPVAHYSDLHLAAISAYAKSRVTVLLSGEGADELLGGYVRYWPLRHPALLRAQRAMVPSLAKWFANQRLKKLARMLALGDTDALVLFNASTVFPDDLAVLGTRPAENWSYREAIVREAKQVYPREPARQAMYSDMHTFLCSVLDRNDRMTMSASIECRVPFLDYRLVEGLAAAPSSALLRGRRGKRLLVDAVGDRLPPAIRRARKWGFSVPWAQYIRTEPGLQDVVRTLPSHPSIEAGSIDRRRLQNVLNDFLAGSPAHGPLVVRLFMLAVWWDAHKQGIADLRTPASSVNQRASC